MPAMPVALGELIAGYDAEAQTGGESGCTVLLLTRDDREPLYLKHGAGRFAGDVIDEAARLFWLDGRIAVPAVRQFVAQADAAWLLTAALPGRTADQWFDDDPGALGEIVASCAHFLRALHALPVDECPFEAGQSVRMAAARRNIAAGRVDADDFDDDHAGWSAEEIWNELAAMMPIAADRVVTHGDFSMGNLLFEDGAVSGCIDVGRAGVADRYQDLAIFWQNLAEHGPELQSAFLRAYGIETFDPVRLRFHRCLDELF